MPPGAPSRNGHGHRAARPSPRAALPGPRAAASAQREQNLASSEGATAEDQLAALQAQSPNDPTLEPYQRQLAEAYLQRSQIVLQKGDVNAAATALARARALMPKAPALTGGVNGAITQARKAELDKAEAALKAAEAKPPAKVIDPTAPSTVVALKITKIEELRRQLDDIATDVVNYQCDVVFQVPRRDDARMIMAEGKRPEAAEEVEDFPAGLVVIVHAFGTLDLDLVEAEQELVGGFNTEYSSIRFALFFLAEFMNTVTMSALIVTLFFGGPQPPSYGGVTLDIPLIPNGLEGTIWLLAKVVVFLYIYVWFRASLPRLRYDQLMDFGWKVLIPSSLGWFILLAAQRLARNEGWNIFATTAIAVAVLGVCYVLMQAAFAVSNKTREREGAQF